ncbi:MAG: cyclase family protein, partial [Acidobacteriota bacterium]|nr:cyclase family protein [Acidobacteriota bacterium]
MSSSRFVELSHRIEGGMITYPGLPAPVIAEHLTREASAERYAPGTTFSIGRVEMVANTGTYVDAPFHRFEQGIDVAGLALDRLADLGGVVVDARAAGRAIGPGAFEGVSVEESAVLIRTGWDEKWRSPEYGTGHPFLTRAAAELLVARGAGLVGIDSLNIDDTADLSRPAHTLLLEAGIPIVEHLANLGAV